MLNATFVGVLVGTLGTGFGALLGLFFKKGRTYIGAGMAFAAGVMIAISCLELLPEAFYLGKGYAFLGFLAGTLFAFITRLFFEGTDAVKAAGFITLIAIAAHNFPEGLAIGSAMSFGSASSIIVTILLHDVPEGLAIGIPLSASGESAAKVLIFALAAGLPTGLGAMIGSMLGRSVMAHSVSLSFAAGAMTAITVEELVPLSRELAGRFFVVVLLLGLMVGALAIKLAG